MLSFYRLSFLTSQSITNISYQNSSCDNREGPTCKTLISDLTLESIIIGINIKTSTSNEKNSTESNEIPLKVAIHRVILVTTCAEIINN